jgi:hypothetical protein
MGEGSGPQVPIFKLAHSQDDVLYLIENNSINLPFRLRRLHSQLSCATFHVPQSDSAISFPHHKYHLMCQLLHHDKHIVVINQDAMTYRNPLSPE